MVVHFDDAFLDSLLEIEIRVGGKGHVVRTETKGAVGKAAQACGAALPPVLRPCVPPVSHGQDAHAA
jgi:hypothetical protein